MKTGRNDPCPCGSGKKYKKCCLTKDLARNAAAPLRGVSPKLREGEVSGLAPAPRPSMPQPTPFVPPPPPAPPPPRERTAQDELWEQFEAASYEEEISLFLNSLENTELLNEEIAAEMLFALEPVMIGAGQRERMDEILEQTRRRRPELYADLTPSLANMRIVTALLADRPDAVRRLGLELAEVGHKRPDSYHRVLDVLAYHGQLSGLIEMMRVSWPKLKDESDIFAWALEEYANTSGCYEMFAEADGEPVAETIPSSLRERLLHYIDEPNEEFIANAWSRLTGQARQDWTMSDFKFAKRPKKRDRFGDEEDDDRKPWHDKARDRLWDLSIDFLVEAHRQGTVSWTRGELARKPLVRYLLRRFDGELEPQPNLWEKQPARKPLPPTRPAHVLCPDPDTLDRFLANLLGAFNLCYYEAAALFELIPAWLRFLEARQLLSAELRQQTLQKLQAMRSTLTTLWQKYPYDPSLLQGLQRAWEGTA